MPRTDAQRLADQKRYAANRTKIRAAQKRYYEANRETIKAATKQWAAENSEKVKAAKKKYVKENAEETQARQRRWEKRNTEKIKLAAKKGHLLRTYGLTLEEFEEMSLAQGNTCSICKKPGELVVDHCHKTGRVRGLPCRLCNTGLGIFRDNPEFLRAAAVYLEKSKS